jgi:hypothetical protein
MVALTVAFAVVTVAVARLRGLAALFGLAFAFFVMLQFLLPGLLGDSSPTLISLVGSAAIMFVVLYLAHGFSARTTTALVGTLFGLALVAVLGAVSVATARLTGLTSEETTQLQTFDPALDFSGLVLAGVVVAGLGVLNDVTITRPRRSGSCTRSTRAGPERVVPPRDGGRARDHHRLDRLHDRLRLRGASLPLLMLFRGLSAAFGRRHRPPPRWPRRSSARWSAPSPGARRPGDDGGRRVLRQGAATAAGAAPSGQDDRAPDRVRPMSDAVPVSTDLLDRRPGRPGVHADDEGGALYEAARAVSVPGPLLEVGSWMGKSALYLAAAARETGRPGGHRRPPPRSRSTSPAGSTTTPRWSTRTSA